MRSGVQIHCNGHQILPCDIMTLTHMGGEQSVSPFGRYLHCSSIALAQETPFVGPCL